jgi:RNA polymerase sigma-70 factor (ECF subfamily)
MNKEEAVWSENMRRAQKGDAHAYRELLEAARALITVYASRALARMGIEDRASAEDLVQETLLALHDKRHTYDPAQPFMPWLIAIARYKVIDFGRRKSRDRKAIEFSLIEETLASPVFIEPGTDRDLAALLGTLPERSRRAVTALKLEGLSVAETAAREGASESAIKVTVHRALKTLRKVVSKEGRR